MWPAVTVRALLRINRQDGVVRIDARREPTIEELGRDPGPGERWCFGEFELELDTGELRRNGERVPLQPQPARVLQLLAGRAGTVVRRSALQEALWGDGGDVDPEQGLNYCILQIRRALEDDAESPRFVETVPRRGYRFLQDVRRQAAALPRVAPPRAWRRRRLLGAAGTLALVGAAAWFMAARQGTGPPARPHLTVLPLEGSAATEAAAAALTDELLAQIVSRYGDRLAVVAAPRAAAGEGEVPPDASYYRMGGTVAPAAGRLRSVVWLERLADRQQLWIATYELSDEPADRARCARRMAEELAGRLGLTASPGVGR